MIRRQFAADYVVDPYSGVECENMADSGEALLAAPRHEVRAHLEQVLASPHFRHSRRCSALLRYAVEQSLDNQGEFIKERTVGQAVFDRDPGYDTNQDAVVRNAAAEVRKRLAQYYQEAGPAANGLRIELPLGTYIPEFRTAALPVTPKAMEKSAKRGNAGMSEIPSAAPTRLLPSTTLYTMVPKPRVAMAR